jgi:hypothetical protein
LGPTVQGAVNVKLLQWGFSKGDQLDITSEQMISLIDLFPRDELAAKATPLPAQNRKNVPGSVGPDLLDDFLEVSVNCASTRTPQSTKRSTCEWRHSPNSSCG